MGTGTTDRGVAGTGRAGTVGTRRTVAVGAAVRVALGSVVAVALGAAGVAMSLGTMAWPAGTGNGTAASFSIVTASSGISGR